MIGIVVIALVVLVSLLLVVRAARSRSERSDWLGELSEIRRSSLGDDEEVTGALEAVSVAADDESDGARRREPVSVTASPTRKTTDSGTVFHEYLWPDHGALRIDATELRGLRVIVDDVDAPGQLMVDLPRGVLWFRSEPSDARRACSVRTAAGWVLAAGDLLVLAADDDWSYVMCLGGEVTLRFEVGGGRATMTAGQIGRIRVGSADHDIVDVGAAALESEALVRRQRRLDEQIGAPDDHR